MNTSHPCACFVVISLGELKQSTSPFLECIKVTVIMMSLLQKYVELCSCCCIVYVAISLAVRF